MEVASEIGRSFDYFRTTSTHEDIARIVISGGCAKVESLPLRIAEHLSIPTSVVDPFRSLDVTALKMSPEDLAEISSSAGVVVGLALRREGDR
jgi:type IV pilus assembly protein PilM